MTMPEHVCDGADLHTDLTHLHEALIVTRSEALTDPRNQVEGLDRAACGPHLKHLAELAAAAAAGGASATDWRSSVLAEVGPSATGPLDSAETCMRQAGLWPWNP